MRVMRLYESADIRKKPLVFEKTPIPEPGVNEVRLKVNYCGVCRTDLHIAEGDIAPPKLPLVPGHQVEAIIDKVGKDSQLDLNIGDRVGVPWFYSSCGSCEFCQRGNSNLCSSTKFTGFHVDGGFADFMVVKSRSVLPIPRSIPDGQAAPLLCAGIIGYRSLIRSGIKPGERLGLFGFGASAHITIQVARHWGCEVYVFTRSRSHQEHAEELGARWVGMPDDTPDKFLQGAIIFAPAGDIVPLALNRVGPGGTVAINAIYMSPIPRMEYSTIYEERNLCSVANATYRDGEEFLSIAAEVPIVSSIEIFDLESANEALSAVKESRVNGEAVLAIGQ